MLASTTVNWTSFSRRCGVRIVGRSIISGLGIGPQDVEQLEKFGDTYLLMNPKRCEVLINAKAVVMVRTDPAWCRKWLSFVEDMLRRHKAVRAQAAAAMKARNN